MDSKNPYIAGNPIRDERGFFGRQDIMDWVQSELRTTGSNVLVLRGQRRIGKTTLLLQLKRSLPQDEFLPVFFNLQTQARQPMENVLAKLSDEMAAAALLTGRGIKRQSISKSRDNSEVFSNEFLPRLQEKIKHRRPIILLDEFDALEDAATSETLFQYFAELVTDHPQLAFVIATGRDPSDLSKDYSAIFKGAFAKDVWVLDEESARALIRQAEENGTLTFLQDAPDRILALTHCHPFLTQLLCHRLWQRAHPSSKVKSDINIPVITIEDVDIAAEDAITTAEMQLSWFWDGLSPSEKVYIAALAEISDEKKSIPEDKVIEVLSKHADRFRSHEVEKLAPQYLEKRNILEKTGEHEYRFFVEIVRRWVKNNRSLQTVKTELDESNQPAERLFQTGKAFYEVQRWVDAKTQFQNALSEYPNHFKSLIYLGETLLKLEEFEKAVQILDKAYTIDPEETQNTLARALTYFAQDLNRNGNEIQALAASERALQLSPQERNAKSTKVAIWNRRGDEALQNEDIALALEAYQKAGNITKLQSIYESQQEEREKLRITLQINPELLNKINVGGFLSSLVFSPDNVFLASGGDDGNITLRGPSSGKQMRLLSGHTGKITSVCYSPKGTVLASGSRDKTIIIWDADIGLKKQTLIGASDEILGISFSLDGKILYTGSRNGTINIWDINSGQMLDSVDTHAGNVTCISFSQNGQYAGLGSSDNSIAIWDIINQRQEKILVGHSNRINCLSFSPDGKLIVSGSSDLNIILWDISSGQQISTLIGHTRDVTCLSFSPDATVLASGAKDSKIILWHVGRKEQIITLDGPSNTILSLAFSNVSGSLLASNSADSFLHIWKIKSV